MFHIHIHSLLSLLVLLITFVPTLQYKPIIGIYANPYPDTDYTINNGTVVFGSYVRWLESAGAEVLAIHQWYTHEQIDDVLSKINGVLFMGGGRDFNTSALWEQNALYIMRSAIEKGFRIWGSCLGFQLIGVLLSEDESILKLGYDHMGYLDNLTFTSSTLESKTFSLLNANELDSLKNKNAAIFFHTWGISEDDWNSNEKLNQLFTITSLGKDAKGNVFVSSFEGKNNNIFATQFHPEANPYVRYDGYEVEHTVECLRISHKLGFSFVKQAKKVLNRMEYHERKRFDFINTFAKGSEDRHEEDDDAYFFFKKEQNENEPIM